MLLYNLNRNYRLLNTRNLFKYGAKILYKQTECDLSYHMPAIKMTHECNLSIILSERIFWCIHTATDERLVLHAWQKQWKIWWDHEKIDIEREFQYTFEIRTRHESFHNHASATYFQLSCAIAKLRALSGPWNAMVSVWVPVSRSAMNKIDKLLRITEFIEKRHRHDDVTIIWISLRSY